MEEELSVVHYQETGGYSLSEQVLISLVLVPLLVFSIVWPFVSLVEVMLTGRRETVLGILGAICIGPFYAFIPYFIFTTQRGLLRNYVIKIDKDRDTLELHSTLFGKVDQSFEHKLSEVRKVKKTILDYTSDEGGPSTTNGIWIQGSNVWGKDWELEITIFYNNSKEKGWENKFHETAQRFAAVLGVEEDLEKIQNP